MFYACSLKADDVVSANILMRRREIQSFFASAGIHILQHMAALIKYTSRHHPNEYVRWQLGDDANRIDSES